jgi:hypothetical protein
MRRVREYLLKKRGAKNDVALPKFFKNLALSLPLFCGFWQGCFGLRFLGSFSVGLVFFTYQKWY